MKSQVSSVGPCRCNVEISVPADKVNEEFSGVVASYIQHARIPGFRAGKAPKPMVLRRFQKDIVKDVKERLVPMAYHTALKEHNLQPVTVLDVTDPEIKEGEDYSFSVMLEVKPDFTLPTYTGLTVDANPVVVDDAQVDAIIQNLREREGKFEDAADDAVIQKGDLVQVDFEATVDGAPLVDKAPTAGELSSGEDFWLFADDETFIVQDLTRQLVGLKKGDEKTLDVTFSEPHPIAELAGVTAVYQVTVKGIRNRALPELDTNFLESLGVETVDVLKERIRKDLAEMKARDEVRRQRGELVRQLLETTDMELPESLVQEETSQEVYDMVSMNSQRGVSSDDIEKNRDQIFESAAKSAKDRLKLRFLCTKIAETEKLAVTDAEVDVRIRQHALQGRKEPDKLKAELKKDNGTGYRRLKEQLVAEKGLDLVVEKSVVNAAKEGTV